MSSCPAQPVPVFAWGMGRRQSCQSCQPHLPSPLPVYAHLRTQGYAYGGASRPDPSADLRQAQLAALALPNVSVSTAIDTGDWNSVHPPDKQTPAFRLAAGALDVLYGLAHYAAAHLPPLYAGQALVGALGSDNSTANVTVRVSLSRRATAVVPPWATSSSTLGQPGSVPRNACLVAIMPPFHNPEDCGWPRLYLTNDTGHAMTTNATARLVGGGQAIELSARLPPGMRVVASSYGRASWPMTLFFSERGVPVLPWYATLNQTLPWVLPSAVADAVSLPLDEPWAEAEG